ncbi:MAG: zinc-ribbon domain-containing protein, partial [Clostridia bacterium]|nr:zinc-ribbon domain-containing protein [Clostridia bacterium]
SKGHEWQASIYTRNKGIGCPICKSERNTSFPEFAIIYYLKKYGLGAVQSYKQLGYELDVFIPSKKIAIEYDGFFWHKNKRKKDVEKNLKCKMNGIKVYRIREGLSALNDSSIDYVIDKKQKKLSEVLKVILSEILGFCVDINLQRDNIEIENLREYTEKKNSLLFANPTLAKEWDYEKNGNLRPENFTVASEKKVWWKCNHGHEWQASIKSRNSGSGCPYCSGRCAINGKNDLATINPTLVKEWNYEKNGELKPEDFLPNSGKKVWWKCNHGHEWQAIIKSRNYGSGCPYCAGQKVIQGRNDLATVNPKLAREWNSKKNGDLKPEDFMPYSNKKVWWKCEKGHMWQATIARRSNGSGCPYCSGRKKPKE